jgi:hypothetical protein
MCVRILYFDMVHTNCKWSQGQWPLFQHTLLFIRGLVKVVNNTCAFAHDQKGPLVLLLKLAFIAHQCGQLQLLELVAFDNIA